jgi:3-oxoacyl-[acyl-carrier-protein] synthase-3
MNISHSPFRSVIGGVSFYVPPRVVSNKDLEKMMDTSDEWITQRSGIRERRWVDEGVRTSHIASKAVSQLLEKTGIKAAEVDLLIAATLSPDYFFPGLGTSIQTELGLPNIGAIDIRAQCSGFTYGLSIADAFGRSGQYRNIVFVGAEIHSPVLDKTTRGRDVAVLFGDGAGAVLIQSTNIQGNDEPPRANNKVRGIIDSLMGSDGSGAENLMLRSPGIATPGFVTHELVETTDHRPSMEGRVVFKHAVTRMLEAASTLLQRNNISPADVDLVLPHQANLRINEAVSEKLGIGAAKVFNNIDRYGNTTSATIPICMAEAENAGRLKKGDLVLTLSFGAGFTWGANLIRW